MKLGVRLEKERLEAFKIEVEVCAELIDGKFSPQSETVMLWGSEELPEGYALLGSVAECLNYLAEDAGGDVHLLIDLFNDIREMEDE